MVKTFAEKLADKFNKMTIKMATERCKYCGARITKQQMKRHTKAKYCQDIQRILEVVKKNS